MRPSFISGARLRLTAVAFLSALSAFAGASAATVAGAPPVPKRNIVFILVDDLRYDGMGFVQPGLHTPNIDSLAKAGTYFPNAMVTSSLCSPSRATILTGQSVRNHGVVDNIESSEKGLVFFPSYLQQAGYQTAFIGKWHMGIASDAPRPGFDKWISFKGQGSYLPMGRGGRQTLNIDGKVVDRKGYITDELTDYALDWLQHGRDQSKPFLLYLSHKAVHADPIPAERYKNQYRDTNFKLPASAADTPENRAGKPMWVQNQRNSWHGVDFMYHTDRKMEDFLREYYAALSSVDDSLGKIMAYLKANGLDKNTLVVFTSDNGFLIGDHGLIDKRNAYEGSIRVPMLMYAPGLLPAGAINPARVRNLDLAPTFLDVAGVPKPPKMEGQSILALANGRQTAKDWNAKDTIYEYYWEWMFPMTPTTFAIERGNMKYIQYHGVWDIEELYDLANDPNENHNLIEDKRYLSTRMTLRKALFEGLSNKDGQHVVPYTERFSRGVVRRAQVGSAPAPFPSEWLVEPNRKDRMKDMVPEDAAEATNEQKHR